MSKISRAQSAAKKAAWRETRFIIAALLVILVWLIGSYTVLPRPVQVMFLPICVSTELDVNVC